jgi:hypothetical protein
MRAGGPKGQTRPHADRVRGRKGVDHARRRHRGRWQGRRWTVDHLRQAGHDVRLTGSLESCTPPARRSWGSPSTFRRPSRPSTRAIPRGRNRHMPSRSLPARRWLRSSLAGRACPMSACASPTSWSRRTPRPSRATGRMPRCGAGTCGLRRCPRRGAGLRAGADRRSAWRGSPHHRRGGHRHAARQPRPHGRGLPGSAAGRVTGRPPGGYSAGGLASSSSG